ncbi:glycerol-3-phosphate transporter, partial [Providencia rettgeri]|nr:glycerol-3-phosphate transporter [Providencia rettgeri]
MVERRPLLDFFTHLILILGVIVIALPLYITFVASTQTSAEVARAPMSLWPGSHMVEN